MLQKIGASINCAIVCEESCMCLCHREILCNSLSDCNNPVYSGVWRVKNCCAESLQHSVKSLLGTAAIHLDHSFLQVLISCTWPWEYKSLTDIQEHCCNTTASNSQAGSGYIFTSFNGLILDDSHASHSLMLTLLLF